MPTFCIDAHGLTDVGHRRNQNEDLVGCFPDLGLFLVVDGMGGQGWGREAARITFDAVHELFAETAARGEGPLPFEPDPRKSYQENRLVAAVRLAHRRLADTMARAGGKKGMGAAVAAVSLFDGRAQIAHVGDCRVHLLRGGALEQLTRDHSLVNEVLQLGHELTPEQLAMVPKNVLTRAIGYTDELVVDSRSMPVDSGDVLLLTSDGVHSLVSQEQILALLREHPSPATACEELIAAALQNGGDDNATCLVVRLTPS